MRVDSCYRYPMDFSTWLAFVLTVGAVFLTPGPTLMMVMALTIRHGRVVLPFLMLGVMCADIVFISLGLAGVAALREVSPQLYWVLRLGSLAYVAYLAFKLWHRTPEPSAPASTDPEPSEPEPSQIQTTAAADGRARGGLFRHGHLTIFAFLTTITNPKGLLFVFGIFPNFVPTDEPFAIIYAGTLIVTFMSMSLIVVSTWGLLASYLLGGLAKWPHLGKLSAIMIILAVAWVWLAEFLG